MARKQTISIDEYYHIYNRGTDKRLIFLDQNDKIRFVRLLYICNSTDPIIYKTIQGKALDEIERGEALSSIGAYCLMSNHFHLLLREKTEEGISRFIQKLCTAYSMYFNKKYSRTGSLFEGPFKYSHVNTDEYLHYLYAYIHLNPIKLYSSSWEDSVDSVSGKYDTIEKYLDTYNFSSYNDYLNPKARAERIILDIENFPEYFSTPTDFKDLMKQWIDIQGLALDKVG